MYLYTFAVDPSAEDRNRGGAMLDLYYAFRTADELTVGYEVAGRAVRHVALCRAA